MTTITITVSTWIVWTVTACLVALAVAVCVFVACCVYEYTSVTIKEILTRRHNKKTLPVAWGLHDYIQAVENNMPDKERGRLYKRMKTAYDNSSFAHAVKWGDVKRKDGDV